jgi:hypothetical protein
MARRTYTATQIIIALQVFLLGTVESATAANPELNCRSPKAPPGYTAFGVGRAAVSQAGSLAAAKTQAASASAQDLLGRVCLDGCACETLAPLQPYSFGVDGDEVCHMTLVPDAAVAKFRASRDTNAAKQSVHAALNQVWPTISATGVRPVVTVAGEGRAAEWLRGLVSIWLTGRADIRAVANCPDPTVASPASLCVHLENAVAGATERALTVRAACPAGQCAGSFSAVGIASCALQAAIGALVCPDDGVSAGDYCIRKAGPLQACQTRPFGGAGTWASAEADGTDDAAASRARQQALYAVVVPIVGQSAASGRDDALEARLRAAVITDFNEFRCLAAPNRLRVSVFVPDRERHRLLRARRKAAVGVLVCQSKTVQACTPGLHDQVRMLASAAGVEVASVLTVPDALTAETARRITAEADATTAFEVRVRATYAGISRPYHVCRAQVAATLWDGDSAKGLREARPDGHGSDGGFKGIVFADLKTPSDACQDAVRNGLGELRQIVERWNPLQ